MIVSVPRRILQFGMDELKKLLVICGPSGSGKSSLIRRLFDEVPNTFGFSVSHTTRQPRPGEQHGIDYYFSTKDDILKGVDDGEFLETATFSGNMYGTSYGSVKKVCASGKICILDIEMQGVIQVKARKDLNPVTVFVKPPSLEVLEQRLRNRGTETEESLQRRLDTAKREMEYGAVPGNFQIVVVNDDLDRCYAEFKEAVVEKFKERDIDILADSKSAVGMFNQETERQLLTNVLKHLAGLDQKMTLDGIIGLLPVWFLQRLQRPQSASGQQPWRKPRTLEEMAEEFALSQRCGALIYEIFTARPRMAYTKTFQNPPAPTSSDEFDEHESTGIRELEYWLHDFMDTFDKISKWY